MFIRDYEVFNPNFISDVIEFLALPLSEEEVRRQVDEIDRKYPLTSDQKRAADLTLEEKLRAFIDRVEFIGHLELVARYAKQSNFIIMGREVTGLHWDIKSLRLYLSLTCIDIFCGDSSHKTRFEDVFLNMADETKDKLTSNMRILVPDGSTIRVTADLREMAEYFYNVRNYYTHVGKRFHILEDVPVAQIQNFPVGTMRNKNVKTLILAQGFNLIDFILELSIYDVKRLFEWV